MNIFIIFTCIEQNELLPIFLEYYKKQGCDSAICLIENSVDKNVIFKIFPNAVVYKGTISLDARERVNDDNWLRKKIPDASWYVNVDVDEFVKVCSLRQLIKSNCYAGYDHIRGRLIDRWTKDYSIPSKLETNIWKQFPIKNQFTKKHGGCILKVVSAIKNIAIEIGHHGCKSENYNNNLLLDIDHFKWWGTVVQRLKKRTELQLPWKKELQKELNTLNKLQCKKIKII